MKKSVKILTKKLELIRFLVKAAFISKFTTSPDEPLFSYWHMSFGGKYVYPTKIQEAGERRKSGITVEEFPKVQQSMAIQKFKELKLTA